MALHGYPALRRAALVLLGACLSVLLALTAHADAMRLWKPDVPVATGSGDQGLLRPLVVRDAASGVFVIWQDRMRERIRLRHLDADGHATWPAAIEPAATMYGKFEPAAVRDGRGGLIVAWVEGRAGFCSRGFMGECDIYAQHIAANGALLWSARGRPVVRAPANQGTSGIALAADGAGGVFVAWEDARPDCCKVYAQHLGPDGHPLWPVDGIRLSPEPFIVFGPMAIPPAAVGDGKGGVLVAWIENQVDPVNQEPPLMVQRLDALGHARWAGSGIVAAYPSTVYLSMVADGEAGALFAFTVRGLSGIHDVAAQRVTASGGLPWGTDGVRAGVAQYFAEAPEIVRERGGGAFVGWVDHTWNGSTEGTGIRAQRIAADGTPLWPERGRAISDPPGDQDDLRMLGDGHGGAFMLWRDCRDLPDVTGCFTSADIYGQHLRYDGRPLWRSQGAPVSVAAGNQGVPQGTPTRASSIAASGDGAGGAILAWPDGRKAPCENAAWPTECDVRAQRITDAATSAAPAH